MYSWYQIHPQTPHSPDCTVFTQSKWHIIHQLRKGEVGHMHNFLPLHGFTPPCQRSPWNSTKKQHWLNDKIVFFFSLRSHPESQRLHQSPLSPASFHVATFSSLQDTLPQTLPSSSLPHPRPHTADVIAEGAGRMLKTRWRRRGSRLFELSPLSSF